MPKILVTGSAGFIGFHLSQALLNAGWEVVGIDDFNTYYAPALKRARTAILRQQPRFVVVESDLADKSLVRQVFHEYQPELVCHLAAQAGVRYSLRNPHAYQRCNLESFINVIEEARFSGVQRFVYASSSSVYGGNTKMPYSEKDPVNQPISLYAATKRSNELMAHSYTHLWDLQTIGLRLFTIYGPWGRPDMAYWSFLENIINDEPIKVFNYGKNRRDFTFIEDVIPSIMAALTNGNLDRCEIINLGHNHPVGVIDMIETVERLIDKVAIKEMVPAQPGDVVATYADIEQARNKLGFKPETPLEVGLKRFVEWYQEHPDLVQEVRRFRERSK
jgi:UDP-glucuronate 4-epimerase